MELPTESKLAKIGASFMVKENKRYAHRMNMIHKKMRLSIDNWKKDGYASREAYLEDEPYYKIALKPYEESKSDGIKEATPIARQALAITKGLLEDGTKTKRIPLHRMSTLKRNALKSMFSEIDKFMLEYSICAILDDVTPYHATLIIFLDKLLE